MKQISEPWSWIILFLKIRTFFIKSRLNILRRWTNETLNSRDRFFRWSRYRTAPSTCSLTSARLPFDNDTFHRECSSRCWPLFKCMLVSSYSRVTILWLHLRLIGAKGKPGRNCLQIAASSTWITRTVRYCQDFDTTWLPGMESLQCFLLSQLRLVRAHRNC